MNRLRVLAGLVLLFPCSVLAQPADDTSLDDDLPPPEVEEDDDGDDRRRGDLGVGEEFELRARDRVISAARTETTIQEVPAIVTVITRDELVGRGFRTLNDVLETIPGFEGNRTEGNWWTVGPLARGNPRTVLVLLNGNSIIEPLRNTQTLDRKLPIHVIERIEVTSGPGGVLWGSNALLGVVNITTLSARDNEGFTFEVGGGHGDRERAAASINASYGAELVEDVFLFANLNFFTSGGNVITADSLKVVGVLPEPEPDGISLFIPGDIETDPSRNYFGSLFLDFRGGPIAITAFIEIEEEPRAQAYGGAVVTTDARSAGTAAAVGEVDSVENVGTDQISSVQINYRDRFADDDFGFSATMFYMNFLIAETPFGSFPPNDLLPRGMSTIFVSNGSHRLGLNVDADYLLPANNHLIFGAETVTDIFLGLTQEFPVNPADPDPNRPTFVDELVSEVTRIIGAVYVSNEWRASDAVAINFGARVQASNAYDPTVLLAGALVWNMFADTFLKLNYSEGFRPASIQSTNSNSDIDSGIIITSNPDLEVETSRAIDVELNTILAEDGAVIDRWFARVDYSFTQLADIIQPVRGTWENTGNRFIHSVEFLSRVEFVGRHELSIAYYFVEVQDDALGPLRNNANHIFNGNLRLQIVEDLLHFSSDVTWIGPREDANRRIPAGEEGGGTVFVYPTDTLIERLDAVTLVRAGFRLEGLAEHYNASIFGENILDQDYRVPDLFFDERVATRPYFAPGWSVFATFGAEF